MNFWQKSPLNNIGPRDHQEGNLQVGVSNLQIGVELPEKLVRGCLGMQNQTEILPCVGIVFYTTAIKCTAKVWIKDQEAVYCHFLTFHSLIYKIHGFKSWINLKFLYHIQYTSRKSLGQGKQIYGCWRAILIIHSDCPHAS